MSELSNHLEQAIQNAKQVQDSLSALPETPLITPEEVLQSPTAPSTPQE